MKHGTGRRVGHCVFDEISDSAHHTSDLLCVVPVVVCRNKQTQG